MKMFTMVPVICLSAMAFAAGGLVPVRLTGGPSVHEGRLEVFYNGTWGTVCDDKMNDDNCAVVCKQMGFSGGTFVQNSVNHYGKGTGPIWLDDVNCSGLEPHLDACLHSFWGKSDCKHEEDAGCKCNPKAAAGTTTSKGTCASNRHHIRAFDDKYPGVGRVEIQADNGSWYVICDDFWDDTDAAVFCRCLGYVDKKHFRAYWSRDVVNMAPKLDALYDKVECTVAEMDTVQNIWQCQTSPSTGDVCDPLTEAAAVACQPLPPVTALAPPAAHLQCVRDMLTVCYTSTGYKLNPKYIATEPVCVHTVSSSIEDGICIRIPMNKCQAAETQSDSSSKVYCYNVLYAAPSSINSLVMNGTWLRSACCSLAKNGSVLGSFLPEVDKQPRIITHTTVNFTIACYLDDSFVGQSLQFPINISRGQDVYCKVTTQTWDPNLWLIVPSCHFAARASGNPSHTFIDNKCPTSAAFDIHYYSFGGHDWGFKFRTPRFDGYDDLYVSCDCYVCDPSLDSKPYCDRTCTNLTMSRIRTKRYIVVSSKHQTELNEVIDGPFHVLDSSSGPLLSETGSLLFMEETIELIKKINRTKPRAQSEELTSSASVFGIQMVYFLVVISTFLILLPVNCANPSYF